LIFLFNLSLVNLKINYLVYIDSHVLGQNKEKETK
jgi:hypothetical protein